MATQRDFTSFVQARWPVLVRSLVAEGLDVAAAEAVVVRVLARLRPGWDRLSRDEGPDRRVWAEVREEAGLPPDPRAATDALADHTLGAHDHPVEVGARPLELVEAEASRRRRTRLKGVSAAVVVAAALAGYLAWATTREPAPDVVEEANPAPVPWYADGVLHLEDVAVELPGLVRFVADGPDSATYVDGDGVWRVDEDGAVEPAEAPPASRGGTITSPDGRYLVRVAGGGAIAYDTELERAVGTGLDDDLRPVDAAFAADGSVTYVVSNLLERPDTGTVRLSETGTNALLTCTFDPVECREVVRVSGSTGPLRLR